MSDLFTAYGRSGAGEATRALGMKILQTRMAKEQIALQKEQLKTEQDRLELSRAQGYHQVMLPILQEMALAEGGPIVVEPWIREAYGLPEYQKTKVTDVRQTAAQEKTGQAPAPEERAGLRRYSVDPPVGIEETMSEEYLKIQRELYPAVMKQLDKEYPGGFDAYVTEHYKLYTEDPKKAADILETYQKRLSDDPKPDTITVPDSILTGAKLSHPNLTLVLGENIDAYILETIKFEKGDYNAASLIFDRGEENLIKKAAKKNEWEFTPEQKILLPSQFPLLAEESRKAFKGDALAGFTTITENLDSYETGINFIQDEEKRLEGKQEAMKVASMSDAHTAVFQEWNSLEDNVRGRIYTDEGGLLPQWSGASAAQLSNEFNDGMRAGGYQMVARELRFVRAGKSGTPFARQVISLMVGTGALNVYKADPTKKEVKLLDYLALPDEAMLKRYGIPQHTEWIIKTIEELYGE